MSDQESIHDHHEEHHHNLSRSHSHETMKTTALHDHRNQDSLPIRRGSFSVLPPAAIAPDDKDCAVVDSPVIKPNDNYVHIKSPKLADDHQHERSRASSVRETRETRNRSRSVGEFRKRLSKGSETLSPLIHPLSKSISRSSFIEKEREKDEIGEFLRRRRTRNSFADSDHDSRGSRDSQETEEDVCFPMMPEHVRINGIDFDEIEEFIQESRLEDLKYNKEKEFVNTSSSELSSAALKYTPKNNFEEAPGVSFGLNKIEGQDQAPDRFSFFCSESDETIHAPDIESLVKPGQSVQDLFRKGESTWWLDCSCPTDSEMKVIAKAFGIHPLTAEDIRMQEPREKVELFKSYYFVCFHTFEPDHESEEFLEPINIYIVVFKNGVLSFHFNPIFHAINVRRRVRQLRDYVDVSPDWICYAIIDDITDSFAPVIHAIEYEADAIEDQVFMTRDIDLSHMLKKIGQSRRKVMTLMRLLSGKADVIKMFAKRCQDEVQGVGPGLTSVNLANLSAQQAALHAASTAAASVAATNTGNIPASGTHTPVAATPPAKTQPRGDIALYLGDIQDHVVTMYQNLSSYEKIFSRSHSNYLAQLQVESFYSNNKVTEMLSKVTLIGTILVPLNLITGMFGMNVEVPAQNYEGLGAFFGILGFIVFLVIVFSFSANWWLTRNARLAEEENFSTSRSLLNWGRRRQRQVDRNRETRSMLTLGSRFNRYE